MLSAMPCSTLVLQPSHRGVCRILNTAVIRVVMLAAGDLSALPPTAILAHYLSIAIVLTTIHAQDFQDEAGDRVERRHTIPIIMPHLSRISMPVGLMLWSLGLAYKWSCSLALSSAVLFLGAVVGGRFYFLRTPDSDKASYVLYNVSHPLVLLFKQFETSPA